MVLAFSTSFFFFFFFPLGNLRKHIFPNHSPAWKYNTTKKLYIWLSISVLCTSKAKISFTHTHPNPTVQEPVLRGVESHPVENSCSWFSKQTQGSLDVQLTLWLQIWKQPGNLQAVFSVVKISLGEYLWSQEKNCPRLWKCHKTSTEWRPRLSDASEGWSGLWECVSLIDCDGLVYVSTEIEA